MHNQACRSSRARRSTLVLQCSRLFIQAALAKGVAWLVSTDNSIRQSQSLSPSGTPTPAIYDLLFRSRTTSQPHLPTERVICLRLPA